MKGFRHIEYFIIAINLIKDLLFLTFPENTGIIIASKDIFPQIEVLHRKFPTQYSF